MKRIILADVPEEGVSHNPEIKKQVLLRKGDLPHLTNFSRSRLLPNQSARYINTRIFLKSSLLNPVQAS
jgi:hypothetical protein